MIAKTIEKYCKDFTKIENYDKAITDKETVWQCHHRLEEQGYSIKELKEKNLYFNRPSSELIFLTRQQHVSLHKKGEKHPFYGKHLSKETRAKMSKSKKGEKHPMYGKKLSEEHRAKLREAHRRRKQIKQIS